MASPVLLLAFLLAGFLMLSKAEKLVFSEEATFPTGLPSTLTNLEVLHGTFDSVGATAFDGLPNLERLVFRSTPLVAMPDVSPLASSLSFLIFSFAEFTEVNEEALNAMNRVTVLEFSYTPIESFPVMKGLEALYAFTLSNTELQCAPRLGHYPNLMYVTFYGNAKMRFCWGDEFDFVTSSWLTRLEMTGSPEMTWLPSLESLANSLRELILDLPGLISLESFTLPPLKSIFNLEIKGASSLERIPPPGAADLSSLAVVITGLDLCQCGHLWLKLLVPQNPSAHSITTSCADWATTSLDDLLATCGASAEDPGYKRRYAMPKLRTSFFCAYPLHSDLHDVSIIECLDTCSRTPACFYFNFRPTGGSASGQCVLVAPHSGTQPTVPERDEPGWLFFELDYFT